MTTPDPGAVAAVRCGPARYPGQPPFHPSERYPEAPFPETGTEPNPVYDGVRRAFLALGLDAPRAGSPEWNPLGAWIRPGMTVLVKPNLVKEDHPRDPQGWRYVMTHGSVIRAACDYVALALRGSGAIWLADAPQTDSSWERIVEVLRLDAIAAHYRAAGLAFELVDLRRQEWTHRDGVVTARRDLAGDPRGYVAFDLGPGSEFADHAHRGAYYGADYATAETNLRHSGGRHQYLLSGSAVKADVFLNLPKLKTHKKAGITCSLKNLVGINGEKNWLPHHTEGDPAGGGDEVPVLSASHRLERGAVRLLRRVALAVPGVGGAVFYRAKQAGKAAFGDTETVVRSGNWHGNDTIWRMCLDLNKLLSYGRPDGTLREDGEAGRKPHLSLVDGILAGEGRGPMNPDPVEAGALLFGTDPVAVDTACACLMGLDPQRLPIVRQAYRSRGRSLTGLRPEDVRLVSDRPEWTGPVASLDPSALFAFRPHFGWEGQVEAAWRR